MRHFLVYTNANKDEGMVVTNRIKEYLEQKEAKCTLVSNMDGLSHIDAKTLENVACIIVLGGDGTILQAVRETKSLNIPLIGVNLGNLGYLTEIETSNLEESLDYLLEKPFEKESRMMLKGKITRGGEQCEDWALNDIIISREGSLRIIYMNVYVNGQFLNAYNGDGIIITTPTGSTGYNLSAGGPIVEPKARMIMLTPVAPHTLNARSIILSPEDEIVIEIPKGREGEEQTVVASFDGSHSVTMKTGDSIRIKKSEKTTEFIKINQVSFLDVLHKKLSEKE